MPDLYLSGHAHSYQRYTRNVTFSGRALQIPYIVAGTGGINDQAIIAATGQTTGDHTFVKSLQGYGYLLVEVSATTLTSTMFQVDPTTKAKTKYDTMILDLATSRVLQ